MAKRCFHMAVAGVGVVLLSPLLAIVSLLVRITLGRPVLYRQARAGLHGKSCVIYKFRTMRPPQAADEGPMHEEERLTRLGKGLRAASVDELPELWNILKGDMSLVGPRPLLLEYLERYSPDEAQRHGVRPGLTGLAQVYGRNALSWEAKFALDLQYVEQRSSMLDLKILGGTLAQVVDRRGVSPESHRSAPLFPGSAIAEARSAQELATAPCRRKAGA